MTGVRGHLLAAVGLTMVLGLASIPAYAHVLAPRAAAQPGAAPYGVSQPVGGYVAMPDGTKLWTEVQYPTDPATGERADGRFPVLLTQDPYGTSKADSSLGGDYFVSRGYIFASADVRGTGRSGGQNSWFGAQMGKDGARLVQHFSRIPTSSGRVGLYGCSYLGVNQWYTAAAVGPGSALKAIAPFCTDSNFYDDLTAAGGMPTDFVRLIQRVQHPGPDDDPLHDPLAGLIASQEQGGAAAFNGTYWRAQDVADTLMPEVVANGIPALTEAGWKDIYPGGNLLAYVTAQNAYFHRPLRRPISAHQRVTGRYQAIVGNWRHSENVAGPELSAIQLEWYDTWLKGKATGMRHTRTPLHVWQRGAEQWVSTSAYPLSLDARRMYFGQGSLNVKRPKDRAGADTLLWAPPSSSTAGTIGTYTSAPFRRTTELAGPGDVTVLATSSSADLELSATLSLVEPSGAVTKLAAGTLLGSQRRVDPHRSWIGHDGGFLKPFHPYSESAQRILAAGRTYRFDISLTPIFQEIPAGGRLQLTVTTQAPADLFDFGTGVGLARHVAPTPASKARLAGGVYQIKRNAAAASFVNLPLASPGLFRTSTTIWGPAS